MDKKCDFALVWNTVFKNEQKIIIFKKRATIIFGMKIVCISLRSLFSDDIFF